MGRKSSINEKQGPLLIEAYKRLGTVRAAALEVGVSEDSAGRYIAKFAESAAPVVAQQQHIAESAAASLWNTWDALQDTYRRITRLADQLEAGIQIVKVGDNDEYITYTPPSTLVAAIREMREHIETSVNLQKMLIDIEETRKFQQTVLEAIGEADPETQQRIIATLKDRRAVGLALQRT
jgi:hypothetical protein